MKCIQISALLEHKVYENNGFVGSEESNVV